MTLSKNINFSCFRVNSKHIKAPHASYIQQQSNQQFAQSAVAIVVTLFLKAKESLLPTLPPFLLVALILILDDGRHGVANCI